MKMDIALERICKYDLFQVKNQKIISESSLQLYPIHKPYTLSTYRYIYSDDFYTDTFNFFKSNFGDVFINRSRPVLQRNMALIVSLYVINADMMNVIELSKKDRVTFIHTLNNYNDYGIYDHQRFEEVLNYIYYYFNNFNIQKYIDFNNFIKYNAKLPQLISVLEHERQLEHEGLTDYDNAFYI